MTQQITDCTAFLKEAGEALAQVNALEEEEKRLEVEEKRTKSELEAAEKALKDEIDSTLRKRLQEINSTYDAEIAKSKDELIRAKAEREKAKSAGIEERIRQETAPILEDSAEKMKDLKNAFKKQQIPGYCTTRLFYALHYPRKAVDFLVILLFIVLAFVAVPCGVYFLLLPENFRLPPVLVGVYILAILLFGGIYTAVGNATMRKYPEMLRLGRETWDDIAKNKKLVKKITKQIRHDKSEDRYDLGSYDDEIARAQQKVSEANARKQEALAQFDSVTKNIISDELTQKAGEKIGRLMSAHDETYRRYREVSEERQQKRMSLSDNYEAYLGKEFMTEEKISALSGILERGAVNSLTEAMAEYRTSRNGNDTEQ